MKRLIIFFSLLMFVIPLIKTTGQVLNYSQSTGATNIDELQSYFPQLQGGEMSKEDEERCLKGLSQELKSKLEEIKKLNKNKYYQLLRDAYSVSTWGTRYLGGSAYYGRALSVYEEASKQRNEQMKKQKELEVDIELNALRYKNSDTANQQKIKSDLQAALNQLFDIREAQKQDEVKQLEKRLEELKESLKARKQNKNEIVQRRIQEMLGDSKYLRWE